MSVTQQGTVQVERQPLEFSTAGALVAQVLLVGAAVALPVGAHLLGAPVRLLLPMHWPVLLAGLVFGWRGGLLVGLLAPGASAALSGYPLPPVLIQMSLELATYGAVAGFLREIRVNRFLSVALALLAGRLVFVVSSLALRGATGATVAYLRTAMAPGLLAAVAQVVTLPLAAGLWTTWVRSRSRHRTEPK